MSDYKHKEGAKLQNLLTNSGFGVWSNSTLENVGSDLAPDNCITSLETEANATTGWTNSGLATFESSAVQAQDGTYSLHCVSNSDADAAYASVTTEIGKLYRFSLYVYIQNQSANTYVRVRIGTTTLGAEILSEDVQVDETWTQVTTVFEATTTTTYFGVRENGSNNDADYYIDSVSFYEVTPGCVAADALGPDGWGKDTTLALHRQHNDSTLTKDGSFYSLKATPSNGNDWVQWPPVLDSANPVHLARFNSKAVTFGVWVKTSTSSHVRLDIYGGANSLQGSSSSHTGGGAWEWLKVTVTIPTESTHIYFFIRFSQSSGVSYIAQPMVVLGSYIGEGNYVQPLGEIISFDKEALLTDYDNKTGVSANVSINLEAQSDGKIGKGPKGIFGWLRGSCGTAETILWLADDAAASNRGHMVIANVIDGRITDSGFCKCDSSGDIAIGRNDTFNEVTIYISGVLL